MLLGDTRDEIAGSAWAEVVHDHLGGRPPAVDFDREKRLAEVMITAAASGLLSSAHDLSDGGLAVALSESCLRHDLGAEIALPDGMDPFVALFSETTGRVVVSLAAGQVDAFADLCRQHDIASTEIGRVGQAAGVLQIAGQFEIGLAELRRRWRQTIPAAMAS